jgi:hypothetical protein
VCPSFGSYQSELTLSLLSSDSPDDGGWPVGENGNEEADLLPLNYAQTLSTCVLLSSPSSLLADPLPLSSFPTSFKSCSTLAQYDTFRDHVSHYTDTTLRRLEGQILISVDTKGAEAFLMTVCLCFLPLSS